MCRFRFFPPFFIYSFSVFLLIIITTCLTQPELYCLWILRVLVIILVYFLILLAFLFLRLLNFLCLCLSVCRYHFNYQVIFFYFFLHLQWWVLVLIFSLLTYKLTLNLGLHSILPGFICLLILIINYR